MEVDYFAAINKEVSRIGQVTSLALLQSNITGSTNEFLLHVDGVLALPRVGEKVQSKFDGYKATIKELGNFAEVAKWQQ